MGVDETELRLYEAALLSEDVEKAELPKLISLADNVEVLLRLLKHPLVEE